MNDESPPIAPDILDSGQPAVGRSAVFGLAGLAMLHPAQGYEKNETVAGGICDFCGEQSPALKVFNLAPMAGACYCRKCAPLSETDADWPNDQSSATPEETP